MESKVALIGFGEAAAAFAEPGAAWIAAARGFDRKTDDPATRAAKRADFADAGVHACDTAVDALADADIILCLVTADQALAAATDAGAAIAPGALWCDMNSVAPQTKRAAAAAIEARGGRYVDVAVMAPVHPVRRGVPLLVAGPHADTAAAALRGLGFTGADVVAGEVGAASAIKMIRSVMVKGVEALGAECLLAAECAGVRDAVIASLDASWPGADWQRRFDYGLDRMLVHGLRRAAEMEEVVATLDALGVDPAMTRATVVRQRAIGTAGPASPAGLDAKLALLAHREREQAA